METENRLRFVLFGDAQVDRGEIHPVFQRFLLGFHLFNLAAHASDFLLDGEYVADFPGSLHKDGLEALFGFPRILETSDQVGMLLRNFLAAWVSFSTWPRDFSSATTALRSLDGTRNEACIDRAAFGWVLALRLAA